MVTTYIVRNGESCIDNWKDRKQLDRYIAHEKDSISFCGILLIVEGFSAVNVIIGDVPMNSDLYKQNREHYQQAKDYIQENMI